MQEHMKKEGASCSEQCWTIVSGQLLCWCMSSVRSCIYLCWCLTDYTIVLLMDYGIVWCIFQVRLTDNRSIVQLLIYRKISLDQGVSFPPDLNPITWDKHYILAMRVTSWWQPWSTMLRRELSLRSVSDSNMWRNQAMGESCRVWSRVTMTGYALQLPGIIGASYTGQTGLWHKKRRYPEPPTFQVWPCTGASIGDSPERESRWE